MTTPEQIRFAYSSTIQCSNGLLIEDGLNAGIVEKSILVCETLNYLGHEKSPFGSDKFWSNSGLSCFNVTYKLGEFEVIIANFSGYDVYPFNTVQGFADWLNECERKVLEAAANLTFDTFEEEVQ